MLRTNLAILVISGILLTSCGGDQVLRSTKSLLVYGTPHGCIAYDWMGRLTTPPDAGLQICLNTTDPSGIIKAINDNTVEGFTPKWGTSYRITIEETVTSSTTADGSSTTRSLLSIDEINQDPIGTIYSNATESAGGGLKAIEHENEGFYEVLNTPVLCSDEICGIETRFEMITRGVAQFKVVEYEGERQIQAFIPQ